jgi:transketolase
LGSAIAEVLGDGAPAPLERVGVQDTFAESGPYAELMDKYGLGVNDIIRAAQRAITRKRK